LHNHITPGRERTAINYLVNTYQKKVIKTAYYFIGNMEDAEDLSQEIFIEIIKSVDSFKGRSAFSTWVYRIVVNRSLNTIRKNKRRGVFSSIEQIFQRRNGADVTTLNEPADHCGPLDLKETKEILNKALSELPENQRIAFVLSKYEELSYKEIAEIAILFNIIFSTTRRKIFLLILEKNSKPM
jgi:RNA polymerase sigma-70 factor (ECF subfamily)